ncbi:MAG TPA: sulfurtransferase TusA family protein [Asticcacaulis sp.]|jgi:tRNA 2-thiouridine synthesizing protein A|nr:sulfurtransferase TusA family protein [Asticcacaulis sp.]
MTGAPPDLPHGWLYLDARGHRCPVPTLRLRRKLAEGGVVGVRLLADDPMAQIDVPHFCHQNQYRLAAIHALDKGWAFDVSMGA